MSELKLRDRRVLIMGLGLHGGGVESARYAASEGARVVCTDLRNSRTLAKSLTALDGLNIEFVLGEHRKSDFDSADIIVKNPAVPADSPWIAGRENIETDISLFLRAAIDQPILAVTGSKGKSTVVTALHHILKTTFPGVKLGGNITVSPLIFLKALGPNDPVILELSSWQLADLSARGLLKPKALCITNLMHDHQNRYASFGDYEADKVIIFESMAADAFAFFPDDEFGRRWCREAKGISYLVKDKRSNTISNDGTNTTLNTRNSGEVWLEKDGRGFLSDSSCDGNRASHANSMNTESASEDASTAGNPSLAGDSKIAGHEQAICLVPAKLCVPGEPFRINMLFAAAMAYKFGVEPHTIRHRLEEFPGVPYRMELFLEKDGIRYYDDTTATIPEASAAAVDSMDRPVVLIAGGTDKELDFSAFIRIANLPRRIILLAGSATPTIQAILEKAGVGFDGPFDSIKKAVDVARTVARKGDAILLSPGATSFGMFAHEFERGDAFKTACRRAAGVDY